MISVLIAHLTSEIIREKRADKREKRRGENMSRKETLKSGWVYR